ncbi:MAG TPA: tetratricopeptide repeat protein, partial [Longimicrobium sp.]|nr:tetratricopeptide repeat protein [Longimicrobium sp.]
FEKSLEDPASAGPAREVLAALLDAVREAGSASRVIVTSRYTFSLPGPARLWEEGLEAMRDAELMKKAGQLRGFARARPEIARYALQVGAGNPRLLDRLDAVLAAGGTEVGALLSELEATATEFREALLLDRLLAGQEPGLRRLVALASVYGLPVGHEAVDAVAGAGLAAAHLDRAVALSLVDRGRDPADGGFRYFVSDLLIDRVRTGLDGAELREARARGAEFLHRGWKTERLAESEPLLLEIHRLALAAGAAEIAVEATGVLTRQWLTYARYRDVEDVCVRTLALREDHRVLNDLGYAENSLGKTEQARRHFERAIAIIPDSDAATTVLERAELMHNLGNMAVQQGDVDRGMELYRTALELEDRIGSARGKAATLHQLALAHMQRGEMDLALDLLQSSLRQREEAGEERGRATTLHVMGVIHAQQGNVKEALEHYAASLELKERTGNAQGRAATLHAMAVVHTDQGDARRALQRYRASLALWKETGEVHGEAATLRAMAAVHEQQGDADQALALYRSSLQLEREIGNIQGEAATLQAMAVVYSQQGDVERALAMCRSALELAERASDVHVKAATLGLTGNLLFRLGSREEARVALAGSIRAFQMARAWSELCIVLFNLSQVDPARAASLLAQALWLAARVQMPPSGLLTTATAVFGAIGPGADAAPVVAAGTLLLVVERIRTHPDAEALQQEAGNLLGDAAEARGITPATFQPWLDRERLLEPDHVLPRMLHALEKMVPEEDWLFDRQQVGSGPTDSPQT